MITLLDPFKRARESKSREVDAAETERDAAETGDTAETGEAKLIDSSSWIASK